MSALYPMESAADSPDQPGFRHDEPVPIEFDFMNGRPDPGISGRWTIQHGPKLYREPSYRYRTIISTPATPLPTSAANAAGSDWSSDSVGAVGAALNAGRHQGGCCDSFRLAHLVTGWSSGYREIPAGFRLGFGSG